MNQNESQNLKHRDDVSNSDVVVPNVPKHHFRSQYGILYKMVSTITIYTMIWQSAAWAGAFDMNFSAVRESRANAQSGFFNPAEIKEQSEKKNALIQQRNFIAKNLNDFNRKQAEIHKATQEVGRDTAKNISEEQYERDQRTQD